MKRAPALFMSAVSVYYEFASVAYVNTRSGRILDFHAVEVENTVVDRTFGSADYRNACAFGGNLSADKHREMVGRQLDVALHHIVQIFFVGLHVDILIIDAAECLG